MTHHCTLANQRRRMLSNSNGARETNSPFAPMVQLTDITQHLFDNILNWSRETQCFWNVDEYRSHYRLLVDEFNFSRDWEPGPDDRPEDLSMPSGSIYFGNWVQTALILVNLRLVNREFCERVKQARNSCRSLRMQPIMQLARQFEPMYQDIDVTGHRDSKSLPGDWPMVDYLSAFKRCRKYIDDCSLLIADAYTSNQSWAIATAAAIIGITEFSTYQVVAPWFLVDMGIHCTNITSFEVHLYHLDHENDTNRDHDLHELDMAQRVAALGCIAAKCDLLTVHISGWIAEHHTNTVIRILKQNCPSLQGLGLDSCGNDSLTVYLLKDGFPNLKHMSCMWWRPLKSETLQGFLKARYALGLECIDLSFTRLTTATFEWAKRELPGLTICGYEADQSYEKEILSDDELIVE